MSRKRRNNIRRVRVWHDYTKNELYIYYTKPSVGWSKRGPVQEYIANQTAEARVSVSACVRGSARCFIDQKDFCACCVDVVRWYEGRSLVEEGASGVLQERNRQGLPFQHLRHAEITRTIPDNDDNSYNNYYVLQID